MWLIMNDSFLSVVAHRHRQNYLLVRARKAGDIEKVFPDAHVAEDPFADYRFRAVIPRAEVAQAVAGELLAISYDNFKNSVADDYRHDVYADVWSVLTKLQPEGGRYHFAQNDDSPASEAFNVY